MVQYSDVVKRRSTSTKPVPPLADESAGGGRVVCPAFRGSRHGLSEKLKRSRSVGAALKFADYQFAILVDDLHHTSSPGLNQNGMLIHVSVSVTRHVVLSRHLIIRDALLGQDCPDAKFLLVAI